MNELPSSDSSDPKDSVEESESLLEKRQSVLLLSVLKIPGY